jgi:hypothetical protein
MKRLSPLPVHRVFRHAPYLCALPRNRSLLPASSSFFQLLPASSTTLFAIHSHDSQLQGACSRVPRFAAKPRSISTPPPFHYSTCITARVRRNRGRLLSSRCIESATTNVLVRGLAPSRFRYDPKTYWDLTSAFRYLHSASLRRKRIHSAELPRARPPLRYLVTERS